jgi:hypothetical protein
MDFYGFDEQDNPGLGQAQILKPGNSKNRGVLPGGNS